MTAIIYSSVPSKLILLLVLGLFSGASFAKNAVSLATDDTDNPRRLQSQGACADTAVTEFNVSNASALKNAFACANANGGQVVKVTLTDHVDFSPGTSWDQHNALVLKGRSPTEKAVLVLEGNKPGEALTNLTGAGSDDPFRLISIDIADLTVKKVRLREL